MDGYVGVKNYAVIPARGGSKRIPNKNLQPLGGDPLIEWTIRFALASRSFERVIVSSDSEEILDVARGVGAETWQRLGHTDDFSPVSEAVMELVNSFRGSASPDYWTTLLPTCPFRQVEELDSFISRYGVEKKVGSVLSCSEPLGLQMGWAMKMDNANLGAVTPLVPEHWGQRSQDTDSYYSPSGAIWICDNATLLKSQNYYNSSTTFWPVSYLSGFDIDSLEDFEFAEILARGLSND